jgi:hypothetical protein
MGAQRAEHRQRLVRIGHGGLRHLDDEAGRGEPAVRVDVRHHVAAVVDGRPQARGDLDIRQRRRACVLVTRLAGVRRGARVRH